MNNHANSIKNTDSTNNTIININSNNPDSNSNNKKQFLGFIIIK